jgi:Recombination endonuclease VII
MDNSGEILSVCPRCKVRPRHQVPKSRRISSYCKPCMAAIVREHNGSTPALRPCSRCGSTYRGNDRAKAQLCPACRTHCSTCGAEKPAGEKTHTECNPCRVAANQQLPCAECGQQSRSGVRRVCWRCYNASKPQRNGRFGLAEGQYNAMLKAQNGLCAICLNPEPQGVALSVDHDRSCCAGNRSCGKCIRELVCRNCNVGLGMFHDDPVTLRAAATYVENHSCCV